MLLSPVILTLDNAFTPTKKRNALLWTAEKLESELYQYYLEHRGEFRIERPSIKTSTVGCRAWHCAMREWKAKLHRFREEHSAEST